MKRISADAPADIPAAYPTSEMQELYKAVMNLETPAETAAFFRDLLTMAEIKEFANRWQMVKMLSFGKPYTEIAKKLKTSTTTVTRVAYWLNHGMGGYAAVAKRMYKKVSTKDNPPKLRRSGKRRMF